MARKTREELESEIERLQPYEEAFYCLKNQTIADIPIFEYGPDMSDFIIIKNEQWTIIATGFHRAAGGVILSINGEPCVRFVSQWCSNVGVYSDPYLKDIASSLRRLQKRAASSLRRLQKRAAEARYTSTDLTEVMHALENYHHKNLDVAEMSAQDIDMLTSDANEKIKSGWTAQEVISLLQNTEEVNPALDKHKAIQNMEEIRTRVEARLREEKYE